MKNSQSISGMTERLETLSVIRRQSQKNYFIWLILTAVFLFVLFTVLFGLVFQIGFPDRDLFLHVSLKDLLAQSCIAMVISMFPATLGIFWFSGKNAGNV